MSGQVVNQCDGCRRGMPLKDGVHHSPKGSPWDKIVCTSHLYIEKLTMPHIKEVCKPGQGSACCRYLIVGSGGMQCAKIIDEARSVLDSRVNTMTAKSDNCEGRFGYV